MKEGRKEQEGGRTGGREKGKEGRLKGRENEKNLFLNSSTKSLTSQLYVTEEALVSCTAQVSVTIIKCLG